MPKRILLAGLFHETHTFLDGTTSLDEFAIRHRSELLEARGDGSPLAGVLEVAAECGWDVRPSVDMRATPSGTVDDAVLDYFWKHLKATADEELARGIDGIYLVLHGAMATTSVRDVEGEVIARIRKLPGAEAVPICGVLDLHGNISESSVVSTQGLIAYRSNPHVDAQAAAMDAARLLDEILTTGRAPTMVWEQPPVMWPPTGTGTADDPMRTLEQMARDIEQADLEIAAVNVLAGFSFADTPDTGVSFSAVTFGDPQIARERLRELSEWAMAHRQEGNLVDPPLEDVLPEICKRIGRGEGPILVVEPADNIGGGAPGDAPTVLRMIVEQNIDNAAVVLNDPIAVGDVLHLTPGDRVRLSLGGRGSRMTEGPIELDVELISRSDGRFELENRNSHLASIAGVNIDMGLCAVVQHGGVRILLTSRKTPPFDLGQLRSQGIEPETLSLIGVKAAVAHRAAYDPIAAGSYTVSTPGPCSSDLKSFDWQHVRRPIYPLDDVD